MDRPNHVQKRGLAVSQRHPECHRAIPNHVQHPQEHLIASFGSDTFGGEERRLLIADVRLHIPSECSASMSVEQITRIISPKTLSVQTKPTRTYFRHQPPPARGRAPQLHRAGPLRCILAEGGVGTGVDLDPSLTRSADRRETDRPVLGSIPLHFAP